MTGQNKILYNKSYTLDESYEVAAFIISLINTGVSNLLFTGDLGAGKTTLIKQLVLNLNIEEAVTSPTYTLVNEYKRSESNSIYHMDLYRLKSTDEAIEIGIEEMLYASDLCLIEWPEVIESILPEDCIHIHISHNDFESRSVVVKEYIDFL